MRKRGYGQFVANPLSGSKLPRNVEFGVHDAADGPLGEHPEHRGASKCTQAAVDAADGPLGEHPEHRGACSQRSAMSLDVVLRVPKDGAESLAECANRGKMHGAEPGA